jgi:hypothetical protein
LLEVIEKKCWPLHKHKVLLVGDICFRFLKA